MHKELRRSAVLICICPRYFLRAEMMLALKYLRTLLNAGGRVLGLIDCGVVGSFYGKFVLNSQNLSAEAAEGMCAEKKPER